MACPAVRTAAVLRARPPPVAPPFPCLSQELSLAPALARFLRAACAGSLPKNACRPLLAPQNRSFPREASTGADTLRAAFQAKRFPLFRPNVREGSRGIRAEIRCSDPKSRAGVIAPLGRRPPCAAAWETTAKSSKCEGSGALGAFRDLPRETCATASIGFS